VIGEIIGNFRVVARIGAGGMGEVFLGEQVSVHTRVAIKVLHAQVAADDGQVERFFREAVAAGKIKHAGIVRIHDVGRHGDRAYLIMELLEGETLAARIRRLGRLPLRQVCDVGRQLAGVLGATHAASIIHRDLKPDNVFLIDDAELPSGERVKVLDFGIAKLGSQTTISQTAGSMGTPAYMAPEQWASSSQVDARADIYSLGCLLFEACAGRPPFVAASMAEACTMHLTQEPPLARTVVPTLPEPIERVIARALSKDPAGRPALDELAAVLADVTATLPAVSIDARADAAPRRASHEAMLATQATESAISIEHISGARLASPRASAPRAAGVSTTTLGGAASSRTVLPVAGAPMRRGARVLAIAGAVVVVAGGAAIGWRVAHPAAHDRGDRAHNPFVTIDPPASPQPLALGVPATAPADDHGFRPGVAAAPTSPYAIQEHEVTWSELDPFVAKDKLAVTYPAWALDPETRGHLPATGVSWEVAHAYCKALGGALPTEEQWELAARGAELRPVSWSGAARVDRAATHTAAGAAGQPVEVDTSEQDVTPPTAHGERIYDLIGNAQEWTEDLWRPDRKGDDDSWVVAADHTWRAVRGLPLRASATAAMPAVPAAYREPRCTGTCPPGSDANADTIGFRCAKLLQVGAAVPPATEVANRPVTAPQGSHQLTGAPPRVADNEVPGHGSPDGDLDQPIGSGEVAGKGKVVRGIGDGKVVVANKNIGGGSDGTHVPARPHLLPPVDLLSQADLDAGLAPVRGATGACMALSKQPTDLWVTITILETGVVSTVVVEDSAGPQAAACLEKAIMPAHFRAAKKYAQYHVKLSAPARAPKR
jgi:serine/threonine-protein kinase